MASADLQRILSAPRREWSTDSAEALAQWLTQILKTPNGSMRLRPVQAIALWEFREHRKFFGPIRVGGGKTLISALLPGMVGAVRPLLLIPAHLREKTLREFKVLRQHWQFSPPRIMSYQALGRAEAMTDLDAYSPDVILGDECHYLKNKRAACTRKLGRFLKANPTSLFGGMSGTVMRNSIVDVAHLLIWSLGEFAPVPTSGSELSIWSEALDVAGIGGSSSLKRLEPLLNDPERVKYSIAPREALREAWGRHLAQTPGVVTTRDRFDGSGLALVAKEAAPCPRISAAFDHFRKTLELPDGTELIKGLDTWRAERSLSLGYYYRWNPSPPDWWLAPRKAWASAANSLLRYSRTYDSEGQLKAEIFGGSRDPRLLAISQQLQNWEAVRKHFTPTTEAVWISDAIVGWVISRLKAQHRSIIWTDAIPFGEALVKAGGLRYFGEDGLSADGMPIEACKDRDVIASVAANSTGRNLPYWDRNIVVGPMSSGKTLEQLIARTHRDGQEADEVLVEILFCCLQHYEAFEKAQADCEFLGQAERRETKLQVATYCGDFHSPKGKGPIYVKPAT
jgi:hypothetical protein